MRVLVVEDDLQTANYVRDGIGGGCRVDVACDGHDGLAQARQGSFDVLIIDRMLPKLDGMSLVRTLRDEDVRTPVLFLTAMGSIADRVEGLEGGGDDYLVKPFSLAELKARVGALARRPPALAMLLQSVWGFSFDPRTNIVETHLSHLRAKIDTPGLPSLITTVRGAGYVLRAD
jgi:two-component system OmpR family response regulator